MVDLKRLGSILKNLLLSFVVTGAIASVIILVVVKIFPPAEGMDIAMTAGELEEISVGDAVVNALTVPDFVGILSRSHMLPLIIFSIFFAICVTLTDKTGAISAALDRIKSSFHEND